MSNQPDILNVRVKDNLTINEICKAHGMVVDEVFRQMVRQGFPVNSIQHMFLADSNNEEYVVCDERGYHIEKAFTGEGRLEFRAVPGYFTASSIGRRWVKEERKIWLPN
jgi:hypothetical protein